MKINKHKQHRNKKLLIAVCVITAVLLIIAGVYLVVFKGSLFGWQPFGTPAPSNPTTQSSNDTNHGTKDDTTNESTNKTTDQIPVSDTLVASFTNLSQSNGEVSFSGSANDDKPGGTCSIVFTNANDRPISRTAKSTLSDERALCGPIKIPESEFSYLGEWKVVFRYYTNETQAVSERMITIQ